MLVEKLSIFNISYTELNVFQHTQPTCSMSKDLAELLVEEGLVFGGSQLTATDLVVAAGEADIGDRSALDGVDPAIVSNGIDTMQLMLEQHIDLMKPGSEPMPVVLVGGGALLVTRKLRNASEMLRPEHAGVANAIGAAIAQIGGEAERLVSYAEKPRDTWLKEIGEEASRLAVSAGADPASLRIADVDETSVAYMDDGMTRVRIKAVGDIAGLGAGA